MTTEGRRPTAIIADDHADVHALLRRVLEAEFDVVENGVRRTGVARSDVASSVRI